MDEGGYLGVDFVEVPPGLGKDDKVCKIPIFRMLDIFRSNSKWESGILSVDENPGTGLPLGYLSYNLGEGIVNDVLEF